MPTRKVSFVEPTDAEVSAEPVVSSVTSVVGLESLPPHPASNKAPNDSPDMPKKARRSSPFSSPNINSPFLMLNNQYFTDSYFSH